MLRSSPPAKSRFELRGLLRRGHRAGCPSSRPSVLPFRATVKLFLYKDFFEMDGTINLEDKVEEPKVGIMFNTIDEAKEYYRRYGNELGFSIKKRSSTSRRGVCKYVVFACNLAGIHESSTDTLRRRPSSRTGCKAKLTIILCPDGKWKVTVVKYAHNHTLSPGGSRLGRWGRRKRKNVDTNLEGNVKVEQLRLGQGDASAIQHYFMKMQANDSNFFYMLDLDDEGYLRNVFWSDGRSRAAYEEFGDVVTFDTSYLINKYDIPFALFLGVNHHGQSILLGCGLVSCEDTETFTWLFRCWLACMSGCAPKAIVTDQSKAIGKAVKNVFPNTLHRWFLWHMLKKMYGNLRGHKQYDSVKLAFQKVYDSLTHEEFEERWSRMIENYNLQSIEWFLGLYNERHRWLPIFLKDAFCAGMSTTQRTDGMTAFFDGFVNTKTTIKQFVEQYENTMRKKVQKEKQEDFDSSNSVVSCITHYAMEKQFQDAYTSTKFREFQHELRGKIYCEMSLVRKDVGYSEYEISEDIEVGDFDKCRSFKVSLTLEDCDIRCSCCLFESGGILCRHAIVVLIHNKILRVPDKYIIPRWRKDLKRRHTKVKISYGDCSVKPEACRFEKMRDVFCEIADLSADFEDKTKTVMDWIDKMKKELQKDEGIWLSRQPTITMNDHTTTLENVSPPFRRKHTTTLDNISPPFRRKQSKVDRVLRKNKGKQAKRKNNTGDNNTQESQMMEGAEVECGNSAIFGRQERAGSQDSGIDPHGKHIVGSDDTLPTLRLPDANLTLWGVPQNHPPSTLRQSIFAPAELTYGRGVL